MSDIAREAIRHNPRCEDYTRGVHANEGMHYSWCMRQPRNSVEGADANIRRLIDRCTAQTQRQPPATTPQHQPPATPPQNANAGNCPRGEKPLPVTKLCPAAAASAFLPKLQLNKSLQLFDGCRTWINETEIAGGDVLLYGAIRCKTGISRLDYEAGGSNATLTSKSPNDISDVTITLIHAKPDGQAAINRWSANALREHLKAENKKSFHKCSVRRDPNRPQGGILVYAVDEAIAKRLEASDAMSSLHLCGPFGEKNDPSHWRIFGGFAWYFQLPQDAESTIDVFNLVLLERDGNSPNGWKPKR